MHEKSAVSMESTKVMDVEFGARLTSLRKMKSISRNAVAKEIPLALSSLQLYEEGVLPGPKNVDKLVHYYKCDRGWLLTGQGAPYPDQSPEESRPGVTPEFSGTSHAAPAAVGAFTADSNPNAVEIDFGEAMKMTANVLQSKTSYATALYLNIVHFDRAVSAEKITKKCQDDILVQQDLLRKQGDQLLLMQRRMDEMEQQNKTLGRKIEELKKVGGGCPPIALEMDNAAPTGTDGSAI